MKTSRFPKNILAFALFLLAILTVRAESSDNRNVAFAWGAGLVSHIDLSQHNMSTLGINAEVGMRWKWIRFLGLGVEGDFMVSNSSRTYPIYANFRTDFSSRYKLMFMDIRGGVALNYLYDSQNTAPYASAGVGFTLARGKSFCSHIILSYTYLGNDICYDGNIKRKCPGISMATLRLGIAFQVEKSRGATETVSQLPPVKAVEQPKAVEPVKAAKPKTAPMFVNYASNRIELPPTCDLSAWGALARAVTDARKDGEKIDIVHIGDSHIQAEMVTERVREILQEKYGNAGRGLISPFKLAGTNQPVDYDISAALDIEHRTRLLKRPWEIAPGFTGVAASSDRTNRITFKNLKAGHGFDQARIYTSEGISGVRFPEMTDSATFYVFPKESVYGVYTYKSSTPGLVYSAIGNNGACYSDYLLIDGFADKVATLEPKLIILSMGTNEGFSTMSDGEIKETTLRLVRELKHKNPDALFLMWTPMECHKKNGEERFEVNGRVREVRELMKQVARVNGIAIWDFYEVAGGDGAAEKWIDASLMNPRDHVHLLGAGYRLQGELAAEALIKLFEKTKGNK